MKKKFYGMSLILLLVLSLGLFSTSYATMANSTKQELIDNLTILQNKGLLSPNFMNNFVIKDEHWGTYYIILITNQTTDNVYIAQAYNGDTITNNGNSWTTNGSSVKTILCTRYKNGNNNNTDGSASTTWGDFPGNSYTYTYAYSPHYDINTTKLVVAAGQEYGGGYITISSYFEPSHDYIVSTHNENDVNCLLRNWSIQQWKLGETVDYSTLDSFHMFLYDLSANVELGYVFAYKETNSISGGNALYFSQGNLYANSRYMRYNVLYRLYIEKWLDGVESSEEYFFIFLPRNATVSNGQIIDVGSGDFTVQDSTNAIIANQESGDASIINAIASGNREIVNSINNAIGRAPSGDDEGSGILGGILSGIKRLFVPDQQQFMQWITDTKGNIESNAGIFAKPSAVFTLLLNKSISGSGDFSITIPTLEIPSQLVYGSNSNHNDLVVFDSSNHVNSINFTELVKDEPWKTIYDIYLVIMSGIFIIVFLSYLWSLYDHILGSREVEAAYQIIDTYGPHDPVYLNQNYKNQGIAHGYRNRWTGRLTVTGHRRV